MKTILATIGILVIIAGLIWLVVRQAKEGQKAKDVAESLEGTVKRAERAKDVRSGDKLDDRWLRYRD